MSIIQRIREYRESHGTRYTLTRLGQKTRERVFGTYDRKFRREAPTPETLRAQRQNPPPAGLISVIIPVFNTDPGMLRALTDSLAAQSYGAFEAILYDGGSTRRETLGVLEEAEKKDSRMRVIHGAENRGISGNTNEALRLARGEYCVLCDHDDLITPDALFEIAKVIAEEGPDLIYSDEDRITQSGRRHMDPHYKPDYCPDNLISDNYFCHLTAIRKRVLAEVGGLRSGFDGSQDHDLFLRVAEKTDRIRHIPRTLYSWRENFGSMSHRNLLTCLENGCRAVEEHEARMGRKVGAAAVNKEIRLWYEIDPGASVEALIWGGEEEECEACMGELAFLTQWGKLSGVLISGNGKDRWKLINEAARESEADYLLLMEAEVGGMNRHFLREMIMYAQREDVFAVSPILTDRKDRITHGGYALGMAGIAACVNEGMRRTAGGWHDMMNKVHNVSAVSLCCCLVRRSGWIDLSEEYEGGLVSVDWAMKAREAGKRFVITPHATARRERDPMLLSGRGRNPADVERFAKRWGPAVCDPCYSPRFRRDRANYRY
ncbi:MAG: glycosyltransferase [Clostridia bacterium]|nr:glycosyltransferase [Clostridia bacterium]